MANQSPNLSVKEILDIYLRKNFQNLQEYFQAQNQLLDFKFFEVVFTKAEANRKLAHGLTTIPQDVLVSKITGQGTVTLNTGLFDKVAMDLTATGPCRIRFFAGTYFNYQGTAEDVPTSAMSFSPQSSSNASGIYAGMMMFWPTSTPPPGWILYTDAPLAQATYPSLFAIFDKAYSQAGDAANTFRLPPGQGRVPVIAGAGTGLTNRAMGATGGEENHTLTAAETATKSHSHTWGGWWSNDSSENVSAGLDGDGSGNTYQDARGYGHMSADLGYTGSGAIVGQDYPDHGHVQTGSSGQSYWAGTDNCTIMQNRSRDWAATEGANTRHNHVLPNHRHYIRPRSTTPNPADANASNAHNTMPPFVAWYAIIKT